MTLVIKLKFRFPTLPCQFRWSIYSQGLVLPVLAEVEVAVLLHHSVETVVGGHT